MPKFNFNYWTFSPEDCGRSIELEKRKQLKGIGNAQSPFVVAVAMRLLVNRMSSKDTFKLIPSKEEIESVWTFKDSWIKTNFKIEGLVHTPTTMANYSAPSMIKHQGCRNFVEVFDKPNVSNAEWLIGFPKGASSPTAISISDFDNYPGASTWKFLMHKL